MSTPDSLEDGEIASETEPTSSPSDLNDEVVIDRIVQNENSHSAPPSAARIQSPVQEKTQNSRSKRNDRRRAAQQRASTGNTPQPYENSQKFVDQGGTSWHTNGNSTSNSHKIRPSPPKSVIFGTQNHHNHHQPPPTQLPPQPSADIRSLQNLIQNYGPPGNPSPGYFPPPGINHRQPLHYFQAPPPPPPPQESRTTYTDYQGGPPSYQGTQSHPYPFSEQLMYQQPPPIPQGYTAPQPISPTPLIPYQPPASFDDNYEQVGMEMVSPDEPQFTGPPPVQIPLEARPEKPKEKPKEAKKPEKSSKKTEKSTEKRVDDEDETAKLRALLLSQLSQKKRKNAEKTGQSPTKRTRKNSGKTRVSDSVEQVFQVQPLQPTAPTPRIEVHIPPPPVAPTPEGLNASSTPNSPKSPAQEAPESRTTRKARLEAQMAQIQANFETERSKVEQASRGAKTAAQMAKEAAEKAKEAEELNRKAMDLREKCIEDSKTGKEAMKRILVEKREIQNQIDMMSIEDMEEIDVEEFPEIIVSSVRRDPSFRQKSPKKEEPPMTPSSSSVNGSFVDVPPQKSVEKPKNPEESHKKQAQIPFREAQKAEKPPDKAKTTGQNEQVVPEIRITHYPKIIQNPEIQVPNDDVIEEEEEVEGEDEYEEEDEEDMDVDEVFRNTKTTDSTWHGAQKDVQKGAEPEKGAEPTKKVEQDIDKEQALRQRLMNKMSRVEKSPDTRVSSSATITITPTTTPLVTPTISSSISGNHHQNGHSSTTITPEQHIEDCRTILHSMCKFELNGKCERPRECAFLHLHDVNDAKRQSQVLEGLFREVFHYDEKDLGF